jgi:hypothetical protein
MIGRVMEEETVKGLLHEFGVEGYVFGQSLIFSDDVSAIGIEVWICEPGDPQGSRLIGRIEPAGETRKQR